jgi:hypothetical protein
MTCEPLRESASLPMELPLTSSAAGFPVRTSALPESVLASLTAHDLAYGQKSLSLLANYDRNSSSWRTSQTCLLAQVSGLALGLAEFSETWPSSGLMRNGTTFQLPTLGPGIGGAEFGWLPTPTASSDSKGSPRNRYFGSPTCMSNLREVLRDGPDDPIYPNPELVEEMMGFPRGFTRLATP